MARFVSLLACVLAVLACSSSFALAATVEHTFTVGNLTVNRLCDNRTITAVNGNLPGPAIEVDEGDTLIVHVLNESPYDLSIHWHGVFQKLSGWYDGPAYVTQCPIHPGQNYTYNFTISGQEGTLWWHAQSKWLRATVYGALIIRPRSVGLFDRLLGLNLVPKIIGGILKPDRKVDGEFPIILGEWWNANIIDVENQALASGNIPNISDAFTINGQPGDLYPCSSNETYRLTVLKGRTYLLRIINAAINNQLFYKIANHSLTVVALDASYTNPYVTDVVVLAPGQTADVLLTANQELGKYYMAASSYFTPGPGVPFDNTITTGIIEYTGSTPSTPIMPVLPLFNDTQTAHKFFSNITGLVTSPFRPKVPREVNESMFITVGLGLSACDAPGNGTCAAPFGLKFAASMNNASFQFPTRLSMLEAFFRNDSSIYTTDFPDNPPFPFDYTDPSVSFNQTLLFTTKSTKVKQVTFNSTIEIVLQNTALIVRENHPLHLHGFNFFVLAQGFGNYNPAEDRSKFNLVNPIQLNTIDVPIGGWAVIRFRADNPGVWLFHSQLDMHLPLGLATAFVVENGDTEATTLPPPPSDFPKC